MNLAEAILPAFSTPILNTLIRNVESLNIDLQRYILSETQTEGLVKSNVGGWHSPLDILQREVECIVRLKQELHAISLAFCQNILRPDALAILDGLTLHGWANVLRQGQYNTLHSHPNSFWSGVYFVTDNPQVPEQPFSGRLELIDPRPGASLSYTDITQLYGRFMLNPVAGQVVMFPSWLQHQVHPCFSQTPRISVAFNIMLPTMG